MSRLLSTSNNAKRRANRVRTVIRGTSERPRLSVHISNRHVSAQIIDDSQAKTLVGVSTAVKASKATGTLSEQAVVIGAQIAKQAKAKKIKKVAFDRGQRLYHGRVKALAEAARAEGLEF